jgi:hypothetical protein
MFELLPLHTAAETEALREDLKANGLKVPIITDDIGEVIDGRLRARLCDELNIDWRLTAKVEPGLNDNQKAALRIKLNLLWRTTPPTAKQRREYVRIYPVTLVVSDGTERAAATQHITVSGLPTSSPALVLSAPDEIEFALRPVPAMDVYGWPVRFVPHTLRFLARRSSSPHPAAKRVDVKNAGGGTLGKVQFQVDYQEGNGWLRVDHQGTGNSQVLLVGVNASKLTARHGIYHALVVVTSPGSVNSPQVFLVELTTPRSAPPSEAIVDNLDEACYPSPWSWLAPRFHGPWPRGYQDTLLVAAGEPSMSGFVRFQPYLAAGQYEVIFNEQTPFQLTECTAKDMRFAVRVRHRQGTEVVWVEPLKSRRIGRFEFAEGNESYVQIEARGSTGLVVADAIQFKRVGVAGKKLTNEPTSTVK